LNATGLASIGSAAQRSAFRPGGDLEFLDGQFALGGGGGHEGRFGTFGIGLLVLRLGCEANQRNQQSQKRLVDGAETRVEFSIVKRG